MEAPEQLKGEPLGALFTKLVDRARDVARAEIAYYREIVTAKAGAAVTPVALLVVALLVAQASLTVLLFALGAAAALWIGVPAGLAVAGLLGLLLMGLLAWVAVRLFSGMGDK